MPRLTVGLPLRNSSLYLREAIESVQRQSFRDWSLLAIDDCSTDSTRHIVRDLAAHDGRIILVECEDGPSSQARNWNRAIQLATTELVSMFGHDDIMMPTLFERQIRMFDQHPTMTMCFAQGPFIDSSSNLVPYKRRMPIMWPAWPTDRVWEQHTFGPELVLEGFVHPSSVMMRTAAAQSIGLFPEDMPLYLDIDYWSRLGDCGTVGYVAGDLLRYRLNPQGAFARCIRMGINLSDADKLFRRMMAHWKWSEAERKAFARSFYHAHALRAFRAAETAWKEGDMRTARLQFAICLVHGRSASDDVQDWIARWWNTRFLGKRFDSPRRRKLLSYLAAAPIVRSYLAKVYLSDLPAER
jgi:glycosyltransferase involved in cell wall biosynthesis